MKKEPQLLLKTPILDILQDKKLMGKDKKLKAQIKSAVYLKKKSENSLKTQRYIENDRGGLFSTVLKL